MDAQPATYAAGTRLGYHELPPAVTMWVELVLGSPVVRADNRVGGFSPGVAAVVEAASGARGFVKAVASSINADSVRFHRRESAVAATLPRLPTIPGFLADTVIELRDDTWSVSMLPAVSGRPPRHPWNPGDVVAVFDAVADTTAALTPSPWPPDDKRDRRLDEFFTGWQQIAADADDPWRGDEWISDHLDELVDAEAGLPARFRGNSLAHRDLRADNVLVNGSQVWLVDWANAGNAAAFLDAALLLGDVIGSRADVADGGTIDVAGLVGSHRAFEQTDAATMWTVVAALAAALHRFALTPAPAGLPRLRAWQRQQSDDLFGFVRRVWPDG